MVNYNGRMIPKQREIARKHGVSESTVSYLISGSRFTNRVELALDVARITGKKGIEFINKSYRTVYGKACPRLLK
jgi:transcriptional regulator with XRE-family HTH domain